MRIGSERSHALDLARGLCLILMAAHHLPLSAYSRFSDASFGPFGFFSGVSAFVLISGVVSAKAYGSVLVRDGAQAAWRRALKRAAQLYLVNSANFVLLVIGVLAHVLQGEVWRSTLPPVFADPWTALVRGLLMIYRPPFLDILPMYVIFLLLVVPLLRARTAGWGAQILLASFLVWAWAQLFPSHASELNPFAYQLLFVAGLMIGASDKTARVNEFPSFRRIAQIGLVAAIVLLLVRLGTSAFGIGFQGLPEWRHALVNVDNNGLLRVVSFACFAVAVMYLWPGVPASIKQDNPVAAWVAFLGRHSLPVFAWSIVATYMTLALMPQHPTGIWNVLDMVLTLASLSVPAFLDGRWKQRVIAHARRAA